jgi:hypothetical protein
VAVSYSGGGAVLVVIAGVCVTSITGIVTGIKAGIEG